MLSRDFEKMHTHILHVRCIRQLCADVRTCPKSICSAIAICHMSRHHWRIMFACLLAADRPAVTHSCSRVPPLA
jgi:hypothetical protein